MVTEPGVSPYLKRQYRSAVFGFQDFFKSVHDSTEKATIFLSEKEVAIVIFL